MAGIFFFIFILVLAVLLSLISAGLYVLSKLFGGFSSMRAVLSQLFGLRNSAAGRSRQKRRTYAKAPNDDGPTDSGQQGEGDVDNDVAHTNKKIFSQNEGEYVDFEEVK